MRNIYIISLALLLVGNTCIAQSSPVKWDISAKKVTEDRYEVRFLATLQPSWHIYSQSSPEDGGVPTSFSFQKNPLLIIKGKPKETGKPIEKYEEVFGVTVRYFEDKAEFIQTVDLCKAGGSNPLNINLTGNIQYMACTGEKCLPPVTIPFTVVLY